MSAAGGNVAGAVWGAVIQAAQGRRDNLFNRGESQRNREFQQYMYQRQYQYMVNDMKKAGLNPMLAYSNAPGATPTGNMAQAAAQDRDWETYIAETLCSFVTLLC